jgi:hypothetical protein
MFYFLLMFKGTVNCHSDMDTFGICVLTKQMHNQIFGNY